MPATSKAQFRAMQAAKHGRGKSGIPQSVGEEFVATTSNPSDLPERAPQSLQKRAGGGLVKARTKGQEIQKRNPGGLVKAKTPGQQIQHRNRGGAVATAAPAGAPTGGNTLPAQAFRGGGHVKRLFGGGSVGRKRGKLHTIDITT